VLRTVFQDHCEFSNRVVFRAVADGGDVGEPFGHLPFFLRNLFRGFGGGVTKLSSTRAVTAFVLEQQPPTRCIRFAVAVRQKPHFGFETNLLAGQR
jgi:hypothetical protein